KYGPLQDSLDTAGDATEQPSSVTTTLLRRVTVGKGRERRTSVRRKGNPVGVVVLAGEAAKAEPGLVLNRSKGGLYVSVAGPVAVGTTIQLRACQAPGDTPWIHVLVRHCVAKGERWNLGCKF